MALAAMDVVVIGGGVVGRSAASSLARRGASVRVVEVGGATFGTSSANAGHLVPSHRVPFAAPGMVRAGLTSLVRRDGAFAVSPRVVPGIAPWLWRFARSSTAENVARGVPALRTLLDLTVAEVARLDAAASLDHALDGVLQVATSAKGMAALRHELADWAGWGVRGDVLDRDAVRDQEPAVTESVTGAVRLVDDGRFDPARLLAALVAEGVAAGVVDVDARVEGITPGHDGVTVPTSAGPLRADAVVVAAGVWTPALLRPLGVRLPIVPARGDSVTLPYGAGVPRPRTAMLLYEQHIALNPLAAGLRLTSGYRLTAPSDRAVHPGRTAALVRRASAAIRVAASFDGGSVPGAWTGLRPATPDGLPCIGPIAAAPGVWVASGHGMLGSTAGPGTGEALALLMDGGDLPFDPAVVSPDRFG